MPFVVVSESADQKSRYRGWVFAASLLLSLCLVGCKGYRLDYLAKSDISFVADSHRQTMEEQLREMTIKLYKRNPKQLKRGPANSLEERLDEIFGTPGELVYRELYERKGIDAMAMALEPNYPGDRIFALMAGMTDMIRASYNYKDSFYLLDQLDEQKLYDSARNIEIALWRMHNKRDQQGQLLILTDSEGNEVRNLSYERLFGKMIATQDNMANIVSQKTHRAITKVVQNVATMAFLPI